MPIEQLNRAGIQAYDSPRSFADAVVGILADEQRAGVRSRSAYESIFSVQTNFASRDEAVRLATGKKNLQPGTRHDHTT
jgi:hypothetical protein